MPWIILTVDILFCCPRSISLCELYVIIVYSQSYCGRWWSLTMNSVTLTDQYTFKMTVEMIPWLPKWHTNTHTYTQNTQLSYVLLFHVCMPCYCASHSFFEIIYEFEWSVGWGHCAELSVTQILLMCMWFHCYYAFKEVVNYTESFDARSLWDSVPCLWGLLGLNLSGSPSFWRTILQKLIILIFLHTG